MPVPLAPPVTEIHGAPAFAVHAQPLDRIVFATDWLAQAEHGGFYQALATGLYKKEGLDVSIRMGGPQVNGMQLLGEGGTGAEQRGGGDSGRAHWSCGLRSAAGSLTRR